MAEGGIWGSLREGNIYHLPLTDAASGGTKVFLIIPKIRKDASSEQRVI